MSVGQRRAWVHGGRLLLLGLFVGGAWMLLTLAFASTTAIAAERDDGRPGLLGVVGQTVNRASGAVGGAVGAVDEVATGAVTSLAPVTEPVAAVIPAPVAQPVATTVQTVTSTADAAVGAGNALMTSAVDTATGAVEAVAQAEVAQSIVEPVVEFAESLPVGGTIVRETGLGGAATHLAGGVDATVSTVTGSALETQPLLPPLPAGAIDAVADTLAPPATAHTPPTEVPSGAGDPAMPHSPSEGSLAADSSSPSESASAAPAAPPASQASSRTALRASPVERPGAGSTGATGPDAHVPAGFGPSLAGLPGGSGGAALAGGGSSAAASSGGATTAALAASGAFSTVFQTALAPLSDDDALPGAPVFDTDISPD